MKRAFSLLFLLVQPLSASAGPTPVTLPLDRVVALALEKSALMESEKAAVEAEKHRTDQAGIWQNPSLGLDAGRVVNDSLSQFEGPIYEGTLYQTVPFPGKMGAREEVAAAHLKSAQTTLVERRLRTQHEAVVLSYRLAALDRLVKHIEERKARFALVRTYLRSRPHASPVQEVEKDLIELRLRMLEEHLAQRESDYRAAGEQLHFFIQQSERIVPAVSWWKSPRALSAEALLKLAEEGNPEIQRAQWNLARADAEYRQARLSLWPDLNLGFGYRREGPQANGTSFYTGYLQLNIPLWDVGQHQRPAMAQAKEAERWKLEHQKRVVDSTVRQAVIHLEKARKTLLLFPLDRIVPARKAFDRAESEFRRGRLPIPAFFEIESQSHEMQDRVFESQAEYAQSLSTLLLLLGREMPLEPDDG